MECPEVVSKLVKALVWHEFVTSTIPKPACNLDAFKKDLVVKGLTKLYPTFTEYFRLQSTNFNIPSATLIASFSKLTTKEPQLNEPKESSDCGICLNPIVAIDMGTLPCRHKFHMPCLEKCLSDDNKCPFCRRTLKQGIDQADIEDTQARQAVRSILRGSKPAFALVFAEAALERMVLRTKQESSTWNKRNFAMALVACADCYLRTGKYKAARQVAENALSLYPRLSRLQRAEIFRLQANALAADGGMYMDSDMVRRYTPAVEALFRRAFLLNPVHYHGQIGDNFANVGVWNETDSLVDPDVLQEMKAFVQDHFEGGKLRIHCL
ncbi:hypothetical protein LARI1_G009454 [Lachnellula arida]|uniref:RING-type domain-containing protein n=1 Tax=Lachnellula arida TaxID=1316785 RepID=A0A8T9B0E7_9HELO|nr:hypothetical protein LARI1_G009454 [Lachnellula arida]